jgi:parallel beta-helix repeat protein
LLTLLALVLLAIAPAALAQDAVVPTDFATITGAVNAATDVDGNGLVEIQVLAGTYAESVLIARSNLVLSGEDAATTIIDNPGFLDTVQLERVDNVTVQGFTVTSSGEVNGFDLNRANGCLISGNIVQGNRHGISLDRSNSSTVTANEVSNNFASGIKARRSVMVTVSLNSVHDNASTGIEIRGTVGSQIADNMVVDNGGTGIRLRRTDDVNTISGNTVTGSLGDGMEVREAVSTVIFDNLVTGSLDNGLRMRETSQSMVSMNAFTGNGGFGIRLRDGVDDDYDGGTAGVQDAPGNNDVTGNGNGDVRID